MNVSQPDHDAVLQEFHQWVIHSCSTGNGDAQLHRDRLFLPIPKLEAYFEDRFRVQKLLRALFYDHPEPPVGPDEIRGNYGKVFFILLLIGKGRYIEYFVQHDDLCDQRLPFEIRPNDFPIAPTDSDFFSSFYKSQWQFCAPIFYDNMKKSFRDEEILPILYRERLGSGGSSSTYKIGLHTAYDQLDPKGTTGRDNNHQHAKTYVLKTYETKEAEKYYNNEVSAFRELRRDGNNPSIIGYHGSFTQNGTYNVILEYADKGTLEDYFQTTTPPSRGEDIVRFWHGIFEILNALDVIHNVPRSVGYGPHLLKGWHQDVKPANILLKSRHGGSAFDCHFKLADLGLSHFTRTVLPNGDATGNDTRGTQAYGAPECYRVNDLVDKQSMQVTPSIDIYSLGCVFSEAAIWVVRGRDGLDEYRRRRRMENQAITNSRVSDCFHDGNATLSVVHQMHDNLFEDFGRSDHVTGATWDRIIKEMLEVEAGRPTARVLYIKSERILSEAEEKLKVSAMRRFSGGTPAARNSRSIMDDRARTPPQIPHGYPQYQSRTPQRYGTIPDKDTSSPESMAYPKITNGHPVYNFNPPITPAWESPMCSPLAGRNGGPLSKSFQGYNQAGSDDGDHFLAAPSSPVSSEQGYSHPSTSRAQRQGIFSSRKGRDYVRAGTFPVASPGNGHDMLDRDMALTGRDSRQDPFAASSTAFSGEDARPLGERPHSGRRKRQPSPPVAINSEIAQPPLIESSRMPPNTPSPIPKQRRPSLSVPVAHKWKNDAKSRIKTSLPDGYLREALNKRDHVFLIDDSFSMKDHRQEVEDLFGLLAYLVKDSDPDGIELHFTISSEKYRSKRGKTKELTKVLQNKRYEGDSNIRSSLRNIVQKYKEGWKEPVKPTSSRWSFRGKSTEPVRDLNVYVFTDGIWQPACDPTEIIADLVSDLKGQKVLKEQFGIQFISFGDNPDGLSTLERLDSGLNLPLDIIDTEPSDGNIWKMLLGAVSTWFDDDTPPIPEWIATNGNGNYGEHVLT